MTIKIERVLSFAEYVQLGDDAVARGFYRNDRRVFLPGLAWYQPFYFDPLGELAKLPRGKGFRETAMIKSRTDDGYQFLSVHYWRDWSSVRPPIAVVCPNGEVWEVDRKSSNGDGWIVRGELPEISCSPSIVVEGYHGFLGTNGASAGQFTADIEGRGPHGTPRAYPDPVVTLAQSPTRGVTRPDLVERARALVVAGIEKGMGDDEILGMILAAHSPSSAMTIEDVAAIRAEVRPA